MQVPENEYLKYPREFRLLEELKQSDGLINFGTSDINMRIFDVNLLLDKTFESKSFQITIPDDYPKSMPKLNGNIDNKILDTYNWTENTTVKEFLLHIYKQFNK